MSKLVMRDSASATTTRISVDTSSTLPTTTVGFANEEVAVLMSGEEAWLYENPEALASVRRGLRQALEGRGRVLSFAQYADED